MRVLLIVPSNLSDAPYVNQYLEILEKENIVFDLLVWDRRNVEIKNENLFKDNKGNTRRNFFDYKKFYIFCKNNINKKEYDKYIIFTVQLLFFLRKFIKNNSEKILIDIRDYHKIKKIFNFNHILNKVNQVVVSSPGFSKWIKRKDLIVSHNISNYSITEKPNQLETGIIDIAYIGQIRDYKINYLFIKEMSNNRRFILSYHGKNTIPMIEEKVKSIKTNNVIFTGYYDKKDENSLYQKSSMINILLEKDINSKTLLPNRLYNSILNNKPVIVMNSSYLACIVKKYNLGLVLDDFKNISTNIEKYLETFSYNIYNKGLNSFLKIVEEDQKKFQNRIKQFLTEK